MLVAQTTEVRVIYQDATGSFVVGRMYLPASTSLASAQAAAEAFISVARVLTDCTIAQFSVAYRVRETGNIEPRSAQFASPVAEFLFSLTSDATLHTLIDIPLVPAWLQTSGPFAGLDIDLTNTDVTSFTDMITTGPWVDPFAQDIGPVVVGYKKDIE